MNIVYLIGNGFDINLGMNTRYTDFYNYYLSLPQDNDNNAVKRFKKRLKENFLNWSDLEYALGAKYLNKINEKDAVNIHKHITMHLPKYLTEEEDRHVINASQEKFLKYLSEPYSGNWLLSQEIEEIKKYMSTFKQEICNIKIITFNYTKSIERILGFNIDQPRQKDMNSNIYNIEIEHIHGFTDDRLILGVNDTSQINNKSLRENVRIIKRYIKADCIQTYKSDHDAKCQKWLNDANLICLFGLSFGDSDKKWWDLVSKELQRDCKTIIFGYAEEEFGRNDGPDIDDFKENVKEKFLSKTDIKKDLKDTLKKNIYIAPKTPSTDIFKFDVRTIREPPIYEPKKTAQSRVTVVIGILVGLVLCFVSVALFVWLRPQTDKLENEDSIIIASTPTRSLLDTLVTTSPETLTLSTRPSTERSQNKDSLEPRRFVPNKNQEESYLQAYIKENTDIDQAIKDYIANTKAFPRDSRNFVRLGTIYAKKYETLAQAAVNLNQAVKLVDNDPEVWLLLAQVNGRLDKVDGELAAYKKYIMLNPNDLAARRRVGEINYGKKQWSDAIANLEMFLASNDKDVQALIMLVDAYVATNQQQKAMEHLTKVKNMRNDDPDIRERIYMVYKKEGKKELAESEIKELVKITNDNRYRLMLCGDLLEAGKLDEALAVANAVKKSDPTNRDGLMALAGIQRIQKKYADAIETYKLILFADANYAPACAGRAEAHFLLAEYDRAETYYKKALALDPKMVSAELGLSRVYKATKQKDLQMQHLNRAKLLDPNNKAVQDEIRLLK